MHASFMQRTQGYGWRFFPRKTNVDRNLLDGYCWKVQRNEYTASAHWAGIRFSSRLYSQNTLRDHRVCYTCKCGSQIEPHVLNSMRSVVCISLYSPSAACNVTSMHLTELPCKHVGCCLHYMQYNLTAQSQHMHHIWLALQWWLRFFRGGHPFALFHSSIWLQVGLSLLLAAAWEAFAASKCRQPFQACGPELFLWSIVCLPTMSVLARR